MNTTAFIASLVEHPTLPKPTPYLFEKDDPSNPLNKPFVRYISSWELFKTQTKAEEVVNKIKSGPMGYASSVDESIARIMDDLFPFAIDSIKMTFRNAEGKLLLLPLVCKEKVLDYVRDEVVLLCKLVDNGSFDECLDKTLTTPKATICLVIDVVNDGYETTSEFFNKEEEVFFFEDILEEGDNLKIHFSAVVVFSVKGTDEPKPLTKEQYDRIVVPHKVKA